ncbi:UNVERIFIED_CONTAM: hypothetical protein HDU68_012068 [Siphonaria sp. JEL0065]|nr:hypothetical protein HDU68_012068 [Siphonaria sp. JEL0065]
MKPIHRLFARSSNTVTPPITPDPIDTTKTTCKVVQGYEACLPDELSIQCNDLVDVLRILDDGWCEGRLIGDPNNKSGMLPAACVFPTPIKFGKFKVTEDYTVSRSDELAIQIGDYVLVSQILNDGWGKGCVVAADGEKGPIGVFPLVCVGLEFPNVNTNKRSSWLS